MGIPIPGGFADVEDSFAVLPAGTYSAVVFKGEVKEAGEKAKHPGSQYIAWEFNITDEGYEKRKVWMNSSLVEAALPMLMRFLKAVGETEESLRNPEFELEIEKYIGTPVRVVVTEGINPNTEEPNNSVKRVMAADHVDSELPS